MLDCDRWNKSLFVLTLNIELLLFCLLRFTYPKPSLSISLPLTFSVFNHLSICLSLNRSIPSYVPASRGVVFWFAWLMSEQRNKY